MWPTGCGATSSSGTAASTASTTTCGGSRRGALMPDRRETGPAERELTITRVLDAPRRLVFQAWTDPAHVAAWFGPRGFTTPASTIAMDVRPGGTWRATMIRDDGGAE